MKCEICDEEKSKCILCGEVDCAFCIPHFCQIDVTENFKRARKSGELKPLTEADIRELFPK